jgi:chaperone modulatory protein CbpM
MSDSDIDTLAGVLLDEDAVVSLTEICTACGVTTERVTEMVEYGILEPANEAAGQWEFTAISLQRVTTVVRLQRDLGVNLAGAALALDLLDELRELRARSE